MNDELMPELERAPWLRGWAAVGLALAVVDLALLIAAAVLS